MASVQFARSAQTDLLEAWLFIAEKNQSAADHVRDVQQISFEPFQ